MKNQDLEDILNTISARAASASKRHGVHYYEHDRNGHWRVIPEQFAVHAAHEELRRQGYYLTAEAHQGGIWNLFGKKKNIPKNSDKRRYDIAIWGKKDYPDVLCEFKSGYSISQFHKDAADLFNARQKLGVQAILCLIGVRDDRCKLKELLSKQESMIDDHHGVTCSIRSRALKTPRYWLGEHYKNEYSFTQVLALALK